MNYKLIMLPNPILVNDEEIKEGDWFYHPKGVIFPATPTYMKGPVSSGIMKKVIGGYNPLPTLDLSLVAEQIGWVDVEKLADDWWKNNPKNKDYALWEQRNGFMEGFKTAQSLNEKKYSEEELKQALIMAKDTVREGGKDLAKYSVLNIIKSMKKPKEYDVEYLQEGNTIKVTKIL